MEEAYVDVVEDFFGVYLLYCTNPKYLGRVYIGYTVDPNRRISQHNRGKKFGGAWKTSNLGPWVMVMIVHGFPNDISALRFEWAWQHPQNSRRLQHVSKKQSREKVYDFTLRILSEMLRVGPWKRLPLTIRWLNEQYIKELPRAPPIHIPICRGPVIGKKLPMPLSSREVGRTSDAIYYCDVCLEPIDPNSKVMTCLRMNCTLHSHVICLANRFLMREAGSSGGVGSKEFVPVEGVCPQCGEGYLWGDLVRKLKGCYGHLDLSVNNLTCDLSGVLD